MSLNEVKVYKLEINKKINKLNIKKKGIKLSDDEIETYKKLNIEHNIIQFLLFRNKFDEIYIIKNAIHKNSVIETFNKLSINNENYIDIVSEHLKKLKDKKLEINIKSLKKKLNKDNFKKYNTISAEIIEIENMLEKHVIEKINRKIIDLSNKKN
jgi:hypothetical protein